MEQLYRLLEDVFLLSLLQAASTWVETSIWEAQGAVPVVSIPAARPGLRASVAGMEARGSRVQGAWPATGWPLDRARVMRAAAVPGVVMEAMGAAAAVAAEAGDPAGVPVGPAEVTQTPAATQATGLSAVMATMGEQEAEELEQVDQVVEALHLGRWAATPMAIQT